MRERLSLAGGKLHHAAPAAAGFRVHAVVPFEGAATSRDKQPVP